LVCAQPRQRGLGREYLRRSVVRFGRLRRVLHPLPQRGQLGARWVRCQPSHRASLFARLASALIHRLLEHAEYRRGRSVLGTGWHCAPATLTVRAPCRPGARQPSPACRALPDCATVTRINEQLRTPDFRPFSGFRKTLPSRGSASA
jgi:hypothetical protein